MDNCQNKTEYENEPIQPAKTQTMCAVCSNTVAKYKCPRCKIPTCSVACVSKHKTEHFCSGERDPTDQVPLSEMSDNSLRKDFGFLSNVRNVVDNAKRGFEHTQRFSFRDLPLQLHSLRNAAKRKGVLCQFVSEGMARRNANTSRFDKSVDTITWRLTLGFVSPSSLRQPQQVSSSNGPRTTLSEGGHLTGDVVDVSVSAPKLSFEIATDWANERFLLKDLIEGGALTPNPKLKEYPIVKGFVSAGAWVSGVAKPLAATCEAAVPHDGKSSVQAVEKDGEAEECHEEDEDHVRNSGVVEAEAKPTASSLPGIPLTPSAANVVDTSLPKQNLSNEAEGQATIVDEEIFAQEDDATTMQTRTLLKNYLDEVTALMSTNNNDGDDARKSVESLPYAVLSHVDRMPGRARRYFRLDPFATLHENLRTIFFVNEFPSFFIVPTAMLDFFHIMTDSEKVHFRETFRKRDRDGNVAPASTDAAATEGTQAGEETNVSGGAPSQSNRPPNRFGGQRGGHNRHGSNQRGRGGYDGRRGGRGGEGRGRGGRGTGYPPPKPYVYGKDADDDGDNGQ